MSLRNTIRPGALAALAFFFAGTVAASTLEVQGKQVLYRGGTIKGLPENTLGSFDTTDEEQLIFTYAGGKVGIPFGRMQSFHYEEKLARRLGALTTIAVVLVKRRQRRHLLDINFMDAEGTAQAAVFEISKEAPETLLPILNTRCAACRARYAPQRPMYPANPRVVPHPSTGLPCPSDARNCGAGTVRAASPPGP